MLYHDCKDSGLLCWKLKFDQKSKIKTIFIQSNQFSDWLKMFHDERKPAFRLTKRCLAYGQATKLDSAKNNQTHQRKQREIEHDNTTNKRRQPSKGRKKTNKLADSNHFQIDKSIACTNFRVCITTFACMLLTRS